VHYNGNAREKANFEQINKQYLGLKDKFLIGKIKLDKLRKAHWVREKSINLVFF